MGILDTLMEITVYSGIIFAAIMLFKKLFGKRMSPALHLGIWLILAVRLMLPVTFESAVHFITVPAAAVQEQEPVTPVAAGNTSTPVTGGSIEPAAQTQTQDNPAPQPQQAAYYPPAQTVARVSGTTVLLYVWIAGMAVMGALAVFGYCRTFKKTRRNAMQPEKDLLSLFDECVRETGIRGNVKLTVQRRLHSPALLFPSTVMIPVQTLSMERSQIKLALLHELTHYKRKDQLSAMLLLILKTVYWFNPVVWIAEPLIRDDMETACDNTVVRRLSPEQKAYYAHTLISMYRNGAKPQMVLGMAVGSTRKNAEQRIRGIYMKNKSTLSIKLIAVILAGVIGVCCFTTACHPTPEKPVVVNKNDGKLEETINSSDDAQTGSAQSGSGLYEKLGAPATWNDKIESSGEFEILVDAPVTLPNVSAMPVAAAKRRVFTQEEVDKVGELLFGADAVYTEQVYYTKEQIEASIIEERRFMEEMKAEGDELFVEKAQNAIDNLQSMYDAAPSEADLRQVDLMMREMENPYYTDRTTTGVSATTAFDNETYSFSVTNELADNYVSIGVSNDYFGGTTNVDEPYGVSLTKEQAAEAAVPLAAQLTSELQLSHVGVYAGDGQKTDRHWGWACVFTRFVNGAPATYTMNDVGSNMESDMKAPIRYEQMVIVVDDEGVIGFSWINPLEVTGIESEDVKLMSFDEIKEIAATQLDARYLEYNLDAVMSKESGETLNPYVKVYGAQLGLMRVDRKDSDDYYYLPVWDIYSEVVYGNEEVFSESDYIDEQGNVTGGFIDGFAPDTYNPITISAIDGSILNRYTGN